MLCVAIALVAVLAVGAILTNDGGEGEPIKELMRDAVLHESNKVAFFGMEVNPGLISAFTVTGILLVAAALLRVFAVPRFRLVPGKLQLVLETAVGMFDNLAKSNSPHRNRFLGAYVFGAGAYIFVSTIFELSGAQAITTAGHTVALPAPLSDINGAIAMGCLSYLAILSGGIFSNGLRGVGRTLKEFSLPISMSFRLFGAMLSGPARHRAGVRVSSAQFRAAGIRRRGLHAAARGDPDLRAHHAHRAVLRRSERTQRKTRQKTRETNCTERIDPP